ncbi:MAG TPA: hypothetical protein VMP08_12695 [Anaerolineae bacterium]|nr:hypothetical protein [Anaerolineae bacterium]
MNFKLIDIPGGSTMSDDSPDVRIMCPSEQPLTLSIKYQTHMIVSGQTPRYAEVTFSSVLEFRWVEEEFEYFQFPEQRDHGYGLMEILDSMHKENMASRMQWKDRPGKRFGPALAESDVHHFRLAFPKYGCFDVIAVEVSIREIVE